MAGERGSVPDMARDRRARLIHLQWLVFLGAFGLFYAYIRVIKEPFNLTHVASFLLMAGVLRIVSMFIKRKCSPPFSLPWPRSSIFYARTTGRRRVLLLYHCFFSLGKYPRRVYHRSVPGLCHSGFGSGRMGFAPASVPRSNIPVIPRIRGPFFLPGRPYKSPGSALSWTIFCSFFNQTLN